MKRILTAAILLSLLCTAVLGLNVSAAAGAYSEDFQSAADVAATGWVGFTSDFETATASNSIALVDHLGSKCLEMTVENTWNSPGLDIYDIIKAGGAGEYTIKMDIAADTYVECSMGVLLRGKDATDVNSIIQASGSIYFGPFDRYEGALDDAAFTTFEAIMTIAASDLDGGDHTWLLVVDNVPTADGVTKLYVDNVSITKNDDTEETPEITQTPGAEENTADISTIAYAVAAIAGLGALTLGKKK